MPTKCKLLYEIKHTQGEIKFLSIFYILISQVNFIQAMYLFELGANLKNT